MIGYFKVPQDVSDPYYGVEWDTNNPNPVVTRIGNLNYHKTLPLQNKMKACLVLSGGTVNYWLNPTDWTKKLDNSASKLNGDDGNVMIYIPQHYIRFESDSNGFTRRVKLSESPLTGYTLVNASYVGAYEASLNRTTNKLASLINTGTNYRGGDNTNWDGTYRTLLGKPCTSKSKIDFRTYARNNNVGNNNWNILPYHIYKSIFWFYIVEYANRNSQAAVITGLTTQGFKQGGLGNGVTTLVSGQWNTYNSYNPLVPCGASNSLGNYSGEVIYGIPSYPTTGTSFTNVTVPRYRGIENIFGHIWKWEDGIVFNVTASNSEIWTTTNPLYFTDNTSNKTNVGNMARADGYVSNILFSTNGEIISSVGGTVGGSSSTFWCDYFVETTTVGIYALFVGGVADNGASAGLVYCVTSYGAGSTVTSIGSRLCLLT